MKKTVSRIEDAVLNRSDLENFLNEIEPWKQRVQRDADNCRSNISSCLVQQGLQKVQQLEGLLKTWDEPLTRMDSRIADIYDGLEEHARAEILTWLSKIEYERLHYNSRESRINKSGQWLLKHKNYLTWSESSNSMILWLHGVRKSDI